MEGPVGKGLDFENTGEMLILTKAGFRLLFLPHLHESCVFLPIALQSPSRDLFHVETGKEFATLQL